MPSSEQGRRTRRLILAVAALTLAAGPALARDDGAEGLYYERSLMLAAHARCGLFTATEAGALAAAAAQARGAALRAGVTEAALTTTRIRAEARARAARCDSRELATAAARVRRAFAGWARTPRMTFPGEAADWVADRYRRSPWRLLQTAVGPAPAVAGVTRDAPELLTAVVALDGGPAPSTARLVVRDPRRSVGPWLPRPGVADVPPLSASRVILASARGPADEALAPAGARAALAFRFPPEAAAAVAALDPRERFLIEFVFPDGRVRPARLEVGDFAAGLAFVALGEL